MTKGLTERKLDRSPDITGAPIVPPRDVLRLIEPQFSRCANQLALTDGDTALTYAEVSALSQMIADGLHDLGVRPGDGVVVHCRLSWWAIVAMLGIIRAHAHYIAIDAAFPQNRKKLIQASGSAVLTLHEPGITDQLGPGQYLDIGVLLSNSVETSPPAEPADSRYSDDGRHPVYTQFTSGSTGIPKAVTISSAALAYSTAARLRYYDDPVSTFLLCSSISFDSSVAGIFWALASGGHLVVPTDRPTRVADIAAAARHHHATHLLMVPSLYQLLLAAELREQLPSLRVAIVAGEVCQPRLVAEHYAALPNTVLYNEYGPTECTVWSTVHRCVPEDATASVVPIGRPIPGATAHLRSTDGEPVPLGEAGELLISGPGVATELPAVEGKPSRLTTVAGTRAYRTGDLVVCRPDGLLEFRGRIDDQVKVGGFRLELGEVEHALAASDLVRTAAVGVSGRDGDRPQHLVAFVVPAGRELNVRELRKELLTRLPAVAVPRKVVSVAELPTQPNGKVDRRELDRRAAELVS